MQKVPCTRDPVRVMNSKHGIDINTVDFKNRELRTSWVTHRSQKFPNYHFMASSSRVICNILHSASSNKVIELLYWMTKSNFWFSIAWLRPGDHKVREPNLPSKSSVGSRPWSRPVWAECESSCTIDTRRCGLKTHTKTTPISVLICNTSTQGGQYWQPTSPISCYYRTAVLEY